jgi:hypothetical protein
MITPPTNSIWHDWTTYLVATAIGGLVWFDHDPCLLYRQHSGNVVGSNKSFWSVIEAFSASLRGRYQNRINTQLDACTDIEHLLPPASRAAQIQFISVISNTFVVSKLILWRKSSIRRQLSLSN